VFLCCITEILEEDGSQRPDLDHSIRRECLRLECLHSSDRWFAGGADVDIGTAAGPSPAQVSDDETLRSGPNRSQRPWTGTAAEPLDEGEQQWNAAVKKGGKALFDERAKTRKILETEAQRVAKLEMREAHWYTYGEPKAETAPDCKETTAERMVRQSREADAEDAAKRNMHSQEDPHTRERLQRLHEVRLPYDVVSRCKICDVAIPYVGCCADCSGLRLEIPAKTYLETLWAGADDGDDSDDEVYNTSETEGAPTQRRSSRLQAAADTPNYEEEDSDSAEYDAVNDEEADAEQNAMQKLHELDLARMDSTAGGGGAGGGGRRKTRPAAKAAARAGQRGWGRGQHAQRGRSSYAARRGGRVVPAGVLRLAGMRLDYADDLMSAEADDELHAAIEMGETTGQICWSSGGSRTALFLECGVGVEGGNKPLWGNRAGERPLWPQRAASCGYSKVERYGRRHGT
jgi:hypothetical protein